MTKIYGIYGITEAVLYFKIGKCKVKCTFKDGVKDELDRYPAKLITDNPIVQLAIEKSDMFGSKIHLLDSVKSSHELKAEEEARREEMRRRAAEAKKAAEMKKKAKASVPEEGQNPTEETPVPAEEAAEPAECAETTAEEENVNPDANVFPEVSTVAEAVVILKSMGAKAAQMKGRAGVLKTAEEMGVSFPNLLD